VIVMGVIGGVIVAGLAWPGLDDYRRPASPSNPGNHMNATSSTWVGLEPTRSRAVVCCALLPGAPLVMTTKPGR
jgi:hypothetical protein